MKQKRNVLCNRIRSAKSWLNRAEDNFANQNDVQGEINLLLAQAELQHLQEQKPSFFQKNRHFIALFTAIIIAFGGWSFLYKKPVEPVKDDNLVIPMTKVFESDKIDLLKITDVKTQASDTGNSAVQKGSSEQENIIAQEQPRQSSPSVVQATFSEKEMRDLVRTAGQALRSNG